MNNMLLINDDTVKNVVGKIARPHVKIETFYNKLDSFIHKEDTLRRDTYIHII